MSDNFNALVINQEGEKFSREIKKIDKSFLKHGDVLVKVDFSTLNFKDALILKNGARLVKEFPHIPGIDFAGTVVESKSDKFKEGDEIIQTGWRVGEIFYGGYSQYAKVDSNFLVKKPKEITSRQAMMLGTAGLTAIQCAFTTKQTREVLLLGEKVNDVIVTGASGGVGSIAVMILSKLGCNVTAATTKPNEEYLKSLGAKNIIKSGDLDKDARPLDKGLYDGAVDTVGGNILSNAISQTKPKGIVALCGNASSNKLNTNVLPFILRAVKLWGVDSVNISKKRKEFVWGEFPSLINFEILEKSIKEIGLNELLDTFPSMLEGKLSSKILVNVNK